MDLLSAISKPVSCLGQTAAADPGAGQDDLQRCLPTSLVCDLQLQVAAFLSIQIFQLQLADAFFSPYE